MKAFIMGVIVGFLSVGMLVGGSSKFDGKVLRRGVAESQAIKFVLDGLKLSNMMGYMDGYADAKAGKPSKVTLE